MEPKITYDILVKAVETFETNQIQKIEKMKVDTQDLKDFLTIDNSFFTEEELARINGMIRYIDQQSQLYQSAKAKYDLAHSIERFMTGIDNLLSLGDIGEETSKKLVDSQNFQDVVASAIVGQFSSGKGAKVQDRFNSKEFDSLIQRGASAEVVQIIKRIFWAKNKETDTMSIEVIPTGSTGASQDIAIKFSGKGPKGGKVSLMLREDVKSSLAAHYLMSETLGSYKEDIRTLLRDSMKSATRVKGKLYLTINSDKLYQLVAERLGKKYGVVYYNNTFRVNSAIFFTSPDGSIEMGSEMLRRKDFQIEMNDEITKMAIRLGYISPVVGNQDE